MIRRIKVVLFVLLPVLILLWIYILYHILNKTGTHPTMLEDQGGVINHKERPVPPSTQNVEDQNPHNPTSVLQDNGKEKSLINELSSYIISSSYQPTWTAIINKVNPQGANKHSGNKEDKVLFNFISAYHDTRSDSSSITILGYQLRASINDNNTDLYCLLEYNDGARDCINKPATRTEMNPCNTFKESRQGVLYEYIHTYYICSLGSGDHAGILPTSVAMSTSPVCATPTTFIPVYASSNVDGKEGGRSIGVCVQTPVFNTPIHKLISFIEMNRILGAEYFTMYFSETDFTVKTLQALKSTYTNMLDIVIWNRRFFAESAILHYHGEVLVINDCLRRNIGKVEYLMFIDIDELIVPRIHEDLHRMLSVIDSEDSNLDSFVFINTVFMESKIFRLKKQITEWTKEVCCGVPLPSYLHYFNRVKCEFKHFERSKLIVKPSMITDMDIHSVCRRVNSETTSLLLSKDIAMNHHYRVRPTTECHKNPQSHTFDAVTDTSVSRFALKLIQSVNTAIRTYHKASLE